MKKLLLSTLIITASASSAFTNEHKTETREKMIERVLSLPPEPDEPEDFSTVEGVDYNGNDIRDSIERGIAFKFYPDHKKISYLNYTESRSQKRIRLYRDKDIQGLKNHLKEYEFLTSCKDKVLNRDDRINHMIISNDLSNSEIHKDFSNYVKSVHVEFYDDLFVNSDNYSTEHQQQQCENLLSSFE